MMKEKNKKKSLGYRIISHFVVLAVVILLVVLEMVIQIEVNKKAAYKSAEMLMNQVFSVLEQNDEEVNKLIGALKEDYIVRASAASYMIDNNDKGAEIEELVKIAGLASVDEIHIFDETGTIVAGTVPKYYGYSVNDGDQISFFKPMLSDYELTLCQDMIPNTVDEKFMMYAAVWNADHTEIVQVGIEPKRLLNELEDKAISKIVNTMPAYDGVEIVVMNAEDEHRIIGSSNNNLVGSKIDEILETKNKSKEIYHGSILPVKNNGKNYFFTMEERGIYCVGVLQDKRIANRGINVSFIIISVYIAVAGALLVIILHYMNRAIEKEQKERDLLQEKVIKNMRQQIAIIQGISKDFSDVLLINVENKTTTMLKVNGENLDYEAVSEEGKERNYKKTWDYYIDKYVIPEEVLEMNRNVKLDNVLKHLEDKDDYLLNYHCLIKGTVVNYQVKFIRVVVDDGDKIIVAAFRNIDNMLEKQRKMDKLEKEVLLDELTGLWNRRSFERILSNNPKVPVEDNFVFISMDVNGLKVVNDTWGHDAGDELLKGASSCMKRCLGPYGKVFRLGGDEFAAIIYSTEKELESIKTDLIKTLADWKGELVSSVSVSIGIVTHRENKERSVVDIIKLADERMYMDKNLYYSQNGINRIDQQKVYDIIRDSYIKILKVNLMKDTYSIIHLQSGEQTLEKGFANSISEWLRNFAMTGQVVEEDRENYLEKTDIEYLRSHFTAPDMKLTLEYGRYVGEEVKQVIMEFVSNRDYTDDKKEIYLFVKELGEL